MSNKSGIVFALKWKRFSSFLKVERGVGSREAKWIVELVFPPRSFTPFSSFTGGKENRSFGNVKSPNL